MRSIATTALLLVFASQPAAGQGWRFGAAAEVVHDDNATRGLYAGDRKADQIVAVEANASRAVLLGQHAGALLRAGARYSRFVGIADLSQLAAFGRASLRYQPSLGFGGTWYEVAAQVQSLRHQDSALRDGEIVGLELGVGRHVSDRLRLSAGAGAERRSGGGTAGLYDLATARAWGAFDYRAGLRDVVYGRVTYLTGDHVFNSVTVSGLSGVWESDAALAGPLGRPADAYRLDASTMLYELGWNRPFPGGHAIDLSLGGFRSKADAGGLAYAGTQVRAAYLHRFE